ncbi:unnamed protein product [Polarella glacialis]|uniref:WW domain-containing protein n=1 Tax=Polarella glacialis TaxID=89957 RepID=A0A813JDI2_POLGL|nr:unnamed protein product [Polarella glacialis]
MPEEAEELCSSASDDDALVVGETSGAAGGQRQKSAETSKILGGKQKNTSRILPPGWIMVKSKSKPGAFYYAHPATKRAQAEPPATMYADLPEPIPGEALGSAEKKAPEVNKVDEEEAAQRRAWAAADLEAARKRLQEEAVQKRKAREEARRKADEEAKVDAAATDEVIRRAREKRALEIAARAERQDSDQDHGEEKDYNKVERLQDEPLRKRGFVVKRAAAQEPEDLQKDDTDELDLYKLRAEFAARTNPFGGAADRIGKQRDFEMNEVGVPAAKPAKDAKMEKNDAKDHQEKKAEKKDQEAKPKKKKLSKKEKLAKKIRKAQKKLKKSTKMLRKAKTGESGSSTSSSSSSSN